MPELPEVEIVKRSLKNKVNYKKIKKIIITNRNLRFKIQKNFEKLFNVEFRANSDYETWHEDVQSFEVFSKEDQSFIGTLYADFFPRTGKKQGAWMTSYREQGLFNGKIERPVIAIVCNFSKPTPGKPALLTHEEVTTLFHEMGHAMHGMLSNVTYRSLAGTSVLWDFVELPSQLQENWCYEKETLDMFAGHYETGDKIPEDLIQKLKDYSEVEELRSLRKTLSLV